MTAGVTAVSASASLAELRRALLTVDRVIVADRPGEDGVPVAEVRGVVTRGDLLRALRSRPEERGEAVAADDLGGLLRALPGLDRLWQAVPAAAEAQDGVYLVGGAVRDVLLGEPTFDIDLAVEGDGIAFARDLAAELGGRMHAHEKFHTAVVIAGDLRVDVATARTEHYEHPAALPIVEHSSIRQDLQRRDFTINAMAVKLQADGFGELVDPFGGAGDLRAGRVRVLHNLSFIEDPTRIFRAIRYENRYRFAMDAHTRELARACVDMGLVGDLSGARVRDELVALLSEDEVSGSVGRLAALGLAAAIHPGLDAGDEVVARVKALDAAAAAHLPAAPRWRLRLAAMAHRLPGDELLEWLERLRVRRRDARVVAALTAVAPRLADRLAGDVEPAKVGELLDAQPAEVAVAIAASGGPAGRAAELYLEQLRDLGLDVNGGTLREELGLEESPRIGTILAELLRRRRNGELGGRDEQLEAARELAEEVPS
jgi:tRNA nucleotidyltransferase (CCA-adding enzyme)